MIMKLNPTYQVRESANKLRSIRKRQLPNIFQSFVSWKVKQYRKGQLSISIQGIFYHNQATQGIKSIPITQGLLRKPRDLLLPTIPDVQHIALSKIHIKFLESLCFTSSPISFYPFLDQIFIITLFYIQWKLLEALQRMQPRDYERISIKSVVSVFIYFSCNLIYFLATR